MVNPNKEALVALLRHRLGHDAVADPTESENSVTDYTVRRTNLVKLFKNQDGKYLDSIVEEVAEEWPAEVPLSDFIKFLSTDAIKANDSKFTQGYYHVYMDYIHAMYDVKCFSFNDIDDDQMGLPNYGYIKKEDPRLYAAIYPKRKEFLFAWWVKHLVTKKYGKYMQLTVSFQTRLDGKVFDICIEELDIVIEYQEDKGNHRNMDSDKDKKALIRARGMLIEYFQECLFKRTPDQYLYDFWKNQLERRIIQGLIKHRKTNNFFHEFVFDKFNHMMVDMRDELVARLATGEDEHLQNRIYELDDMLKESNEQIKKVFVWRDKVYEARRSKEPHADKIISSEDIADLLKIKDKCGKEAVKEEMARLVVEHEINGELYTNWNGLLIMIMMMTTDIISIDPMLKRTVLDYLLCAQDIHEFILDELDMYHNNIINNMVDNSQRREDYIRKMVENKFDDTIKSLNNKVTKQAIIIDDQTKYINHVNKVFVDCCQHIDDHVASCQEIKEDAMDVYNNMSAKWKENNPRKFKTMTTALDKLQKAVTKSCTAFDRIKTSAETASMEVLRSKKTFSITETLTINEPIIDNIDQIIYTGNFKDSVEVVRIRSFMERRKLPVSLVKDLIAVLSPFENNPAVLYKVKLCEYAQAITMESNTMETQDTATVETEESTTEAQESITIGKKKKPVVDLLDIGT
jgi:hypothetical protein